MIDGDGPLATIIFTKAGNQTVKARATNGIQELWSAQRTVKIVDDPLFAELHVRPAANAAGVATISAANITNPQISFRLGDPSFQDLGRSWTVSGYGAGPDVHFNALNAGGLNISAPDATTGYGNLTIQQKFPVSTADSVHLIIPVTGTVAESLRVTLLETNLTASFATTSFSYNNPLPGAIDINWKPTLANPFLATMSFVLATTPGHGAQVQLGPILVEGGVTPTWAIDGAPNPSTALSFTTYLPPRPHHRVDLVLADATGQRTTITKAFDVPIISYTLPDDLPTHALLGNQSPVSFSDAERKLGQDPQITNGDFTNGKAGWGLWDQEVGGAVTWTINTTAGQNSAHLEATATKAGSIHINQNVGAACAVVSCRARVDYRSSGNITPVILTLYPLASGGYGPGKTITLPPSGTWRSFTWDFDPPPAGSNPWRVFLRANLKAGDTGAVDYRNLTVYPRAQVDWSLEGPSGSQQATGPDFRPSFRIPGAHQLTLTLTDAWGQTGRLQKTIEAAPIEVFPTLRGEPALREQLGPANGDLRFGLVDAAGNVVWEHGLGTSGAETHPATPPTIERTVGTERFYLPTVAAKTLFLQTSKGRLTTDWPQPNTPAATARPDISAKATYGLNDVGLTYQLTFSDLSIAGGEASIIHKGAVQATKPLAGSPGVFGAEFQLPFVLAHEDVLVHATLRDHWGRTTEISPVVVALEPHPIVSTGSGNATRYRAFEVRAEVPESELGAQLLKNARFDEGAKDWGAYLTEIPTGAAVTHEAGALVLSATNASKTGNFAGSQKVKLDGNNTFVFSYEARNGGAELATLTAGLQQYDAKGTQIATKYIGHPLARDWNRYEWTFTRAAGAVTANVLWSVNAKAGHSVRVEVDNASFRAGPALVWTADPGRVISSNGYAARLVSDRVGPMNVTAATAPGSPTTWTTSQPFTVATEPPRVRMTLDNATVRLERPLEASAYDVHVPDSTFQIEDPSFAQVGKVWSVGGSDLGAGVRVEPAVDDRGQPALSVNVPASPSPGLWEVYETIPTFDTSPVKFALHLAAAGRIKEYNVHLKETNATGAVADSYFSSPATSSGPQNWEFTWTPKLNSSRTTEVHIGFTTLPGHPAAVVISPIIAYSHATTHWTLDGKSIATGPLAVSTILAQPGNHSLGLALISDTGTTTAKLDFRADPHTLDIPDVLPRVVLQQPPIGFDLSQVPDSLFGPQVLNGDFNDGTKNWGFWGKEVGDDSRWNVRSNTAGNYARLEANATQKGAIHLNQKSGPACQLVKCILEFAYRNEGGAVPILLVGDPAVEMHTPKLDAAPTWTRYSTVWEPRKGITPTVYLRANFEAGASGAIEFRNVHLYPATTANWRFTGPSGTQDLDGLRVLPRLDHPGPHNVTVTVTDPWGQTGNLSSGFDVLPARIYRTLNATVGVKATPGLGEGRLRLQGPDGQAVWGLDLGAAGAQVPGTLAVQNTSREGADYYRFDLPTAGSLLLEGANGSHRVPLAALAAALPDALGPPEVKVRYQGTAAYLDIRVPARDASIQQATVRVRQGDRLIANVTLQFTGDAYEASVRVPAPLVGHSYAVEFQYDDVWGDSHVLSQDAPVKVGMYPLLVKAIVFVVLTGVALGFSGGVRWWRHRRRADKKE